MKTLLILSLLALPATQAEQPKVVLESGLVEDDYTQSAGDIRHVPGTGCYRPKLSVERVGSERRLVATILVTDFECQNRRQVAAGVTVNGVAPTAMEGPTELALQNAFGARWRGWSATWALPATALGTTEKQVPVVVTYGELGSLAYVLKGGELRALRTSLNGGDSSRARLDELNERLDAERKARDEAYLAERNRERAERVRAQAGVITAALTKACAATKWAEAKPEFWRAWEAVEQGQRQPEVLGRLDEATAREAVRPFAQCVLTAARKDKGQSGAGRLAPLAE